MTHSIATANHYAVIKIMFSSITELMKFQIGTYTHSEYDTEFDSWCNDKELHVSIDYRIVDNSVIGKLNLCYDDERIFSNKDAEVLFSEITIYLGSLDFDELTLNSNS